MRYPVIGSILSLVAALFHGFANGMFYAPPLFVLFGLLAVIGGAFGGWLAGRYFDSALAAAVGGLFGSAHIAVLLPALLFVSLSEWVVIVGFFVALDGFIFVVLRWRWQAWQLQRAQM